MNAPAENPYEPPNAEMYGPASMKKPAPVKAVFIGIAVDQVGTLLCNIVIGILYAAQMASRGVGHDEMRKMLAASTGWNSWIGLSSLMVGIFFSILGGYVCARIARERIFRAAIAMAVIEIAFSLTLSRKHFDLRLLGLTGLTFACVVTGAWIYKTIEQKSKGGRQA